MLLVHATADGWAGLDDAAAMAALKERANAIAALRASGRLIACSPFADHDIGREVRVRDGCAVTSAIPADGAPIAGFYLVQADDLDHAECMAASIPDAASAHLTVRELMPLPGIPGVVPKPVNRPTDA